MPTELPNLAKVFNNRFFRIPDYQRGYAWGEQQLADFWSDLQRVGTDRMHYCGQLTLESADESAWRRWDDDTWLVDDAGYEPYFVVDGQQRLTTAIILLQCLLEGMAENEVLAGLRVSELRERYLVKANGVLKTCLFGYAKDNPSHEFFRTQILGVPSNEYNGARTVYTSNLASALDYFRERLREAGVDRERIFKALTQRFRFNLHELSNEIDVFVAFETMNNRGKPLSRLELLKNRLIYLSTLSKGLDPERKKVRANINAVWTTIYEELGRNPKVSLNDDFFLRAHWILFFGYDKDEADPLTRFLLNKHFTPERLDKGLLTLNDVQAYADSLQITARMWQRIYFPAEHDSVLGKTVTAALVRLKRLGFTSLGPLLLAAFLKESDPDKLAPFLYQAERFLLLVRSLSGTRSDVGQAESYRLAHNLLMQDGPLVNATWMLEDRVSRHFSITDFQAEIDDLFADDNGEGFYDLPSLKFVLFEYEEELRKVAKSASAKIEWDDFRGARNSVEHIYPQTPEVSEWPAFNGFSRHEKRFLTHSLGNLVAVSVAKNAALSRRCFKDKKKGTQNIPGFGQGSFSELKIAQCEDWTPEDILKRGLAILEFIETRWTVHLGDDSQKAKLLKLEFLKEPAK